MFSSENIFYCDHVFDHHIEKEHSAQQVALKHVMKVSDLMKWLGIAVLFWSCAVPVAAMQTLHDSDVVESATESAKPRPLNAADFAAIRLQQQRPIVALVLGSGGARGYAHVGVIERLEQAGIRPDLIVGASAGSIVGAFYASGMSAAQLNQTALELKPSDVRDITFDFKGFFDGKKVQNYINQKLKDRPLHELEIPMYVVATELKYGHKVVFDSGDAGQAIRASISIPSMFVPPKVDGQEYVDGGLSSPVPVQVAKNLGADVIIAVNILAQPEYTETSNMWGLFNQNIYIMQQHLAAQELKDADIVIQPELKQKTHIFNVKGRELTIQAGRDAAEEKISDILQRLTEKNPLNIVKNDGKHTQIK